jgi:hypothetical protein
MVSCIGVSAKLVKMHKISNLECVTFEWICNQILIHIADSNYVQCSTFSCISLLINNHIILTTYYSSFSLSYPHGHHTISLNQIGQFVCLSQAVPVWLSFNCHKLFAATTIVCALCRCSTAGPVL